MKEVKYKPISLIIGQKDHTLHMTCDVRSNVEVQWLDLLLRLPIFPDLFFSTYADYTD